MNVRRGVLWDSSAILALLDTDDLDHERAVAIARQIAAEKRPCFITNYIEVEAHALLLRKLGRIEIPRFVELTVFSFSAQIRNDSTPLPRVRGSEMRGVMVLTKASYRSFTVAARKRYSVGKRYAVTGRGRLAATPRSPGARPYTDR
jgi:hypothetical protein